jgi:uncharacterized protein YecT (DUF1311 family)
MLKKSVYFILFFFAMIGNSLADQAAWVEKSAAYKAGEMINSGMILREYCAPCGDTTWTELPVKQVEVKNTDGEFYQVFINGKGIDLAYVYILQNSKWTNIAMSLGLSVADVPEFLPDDQENKAHLIDKLTDECLAKDQTTAGMVNCFHEACELWDAELNKVYNQLRVQLNPEQKEALKAAQVEWIKYRDLNFAMIESIYGSLEGTMYTPMKIADRADFIKKRTLELESYAELLRNQ